jgi:radical SAM superfamily enzyme YgiQ (UPF0313 family)
MTLAYLAANLGAAGHEVVAYDAIASNLSEAEIIRLMQGFEPDLALFNTTTPSIANDLRFARKFKTMLPDCFLALFGTHITATHREIMDANPFIDAAIRCEPEWTAQELAEALMKRKSKNEPMDVAGCTIRARETIRECSPRNFSTDLDSLPFPAWEHFPIREYLHPVFNKPYLMVNTSRGCVHQCIFCVAHQFYGRKVRYRSVESVITEIRDHVLGRFGVRHIWFYADDFTRDPAYVKALCRAIIKEKLNVVWWTNTRVDKRDEEMFRLMKQAGCHMLSIGGESADPDILKRIRKATKPEDIRETVRMLRRVGINSLVYFLIGLPGETRKSIRTTIEFAKSVNPDYVEFYPATPYPGTEFHETAAREGMIETQDFEKYMCGGSEFVVKIPGVEKGELESILRNAFREFYFRPTYLWIFLKRIMHPMEFFRLVRFGAGYVFRFFRS